MKTIVYGSQTSLGKAYCQGHQNLFCVPGTSSVEELSLVLSTLNGEPSQLICLDGINHLSLIGHTPASDLDVLIRNTYMPYMLVNELVSRGVGPLRCAFVVSQTYKVPQRTTALYCASKAGLAHLVRVMARELAPSGWIINGLAPGKIVGTIMATLTDKQVLELRGWSAEQAEQYALSMVPMKRFTDTVEVCEAIDWLLSAPDYVNGTVVDMTGGV